MHLNIYSMMAVMDKQLITSQSNTFIYNVYRYNMQEYMLKCKQ